MSLSVTVSVLATRAHRPEGSHCCSLDPTPRDERRDRSISALYRKRAATLCHEGRATFDPAALRRSCRSGRWSTGGKRRSSADTPTAPSSAKSLRCASDWRQAIIDRFLRSPWEISNAAMGAIPAKGDRWVPYIKGGGDTTWCEPMSWVLNWPNNGLEDKIRHESIDGVHSRSVRSESKYFELGVSFSSTGSTLRARLHCYPSAFDVKGQSVFHADRARVVCLMNST